MFNHFYVLLLFISVYHEQDQRYKKRLLEGCGIHQGGAGATNGHHIGPLLGLPRQRQGMRKGLLSWPVDVRNSGALGLY
jgi:hypothetical protein